MLKNLWIICLLCAMTLAGCNSGTPIEQFACNSDANCIPQPICHPTSCINRAFDAEYSKTLACTAIFMIEAAYSPEDCVCIENKCVNKNLGRTTLPGENNNLPPIEIEPEPKPIGGDKDAHGCLIAAGYSWCESKGKCLRMWEEDCPGTSLSVEECEAKNGEIDSAPCAGGKESLGNVTGFATIKVCCAQRLIGGDKDSHGCLIAAGYSWCEAKNKCLRTWEEKCETDSICTDHCGDGECAAIVCMGTGCPCAESPQNCPQDCH
jgi:hypothetical protein